MWVRFCQTDEHSEASSLVPTGFHRFKKVALRNADECLSLGVPVNPLTISGFCTGFIGGLAFLGAFTSSVVHSGGGASCVVSAS